MQLQGKVLNEGEVHAELLVLDEPLSFWGGFDSATGLIIDKQHPQEGTQLTGKLVVMPGTRGSSGTPGVLGESLRLGTGPAGLILNKADINVVAGAIVVAALYDLHCPVALLEAEAFGCLVDGCSASVGVDGVVSF